MAASDKNSDSVKPPDITKGIKSLSEQLFPNNALFTELLLGLQFSNEFFSIPAVNTITDLILF